MAVLPNALAVLTAIATNAQNITAGPFMAAIPTPPSTAWAPPTPTAPTPTAPSIRSRPPPPAPPFPRRNQRGMDRIEGEADPLLVVTDGAPGLIRAEMGTITP